MQATQPFAELMRKFVRRTTLSLLALAAILFGAAGTPAATRGCSPSGWAR